MARPRFDKVFSTFIRFQEELMHGSGCEVNCLRILHYYYYFATLKKVINFKITRKCCTSPILFVHLK